MTLQEQGFTPHVTATLILHPATSTCFQVEREGTLASLWVSSHLDLSTLPVLQLHAHVVRKDCLLSPPPGGSGSKRTPTHTIAACN
eukprot:3393992-Amphidinium_carterae.1